MAHIEKGSFHYIKRRKMRQCIISVLMFGIAFGLYFLGLALNKNDKANVFTIFAVLFMLPSVKMLISYIVLLPFQSVSQEEYDEVMEATPIGVTVYTDVVFSSTEKIMKLKFIAIDHHSVICYGTDEKVKKYIREYLKDGLRKRGYQFQFELVDSFASFKKKVSKMSLTPEQMTEEYEEVRAYIYSLMV